ncbi:hypothetical protein [Roseivivax sp. CAU 1753]
MRHHPTTPTSPRSDRLQRLFAIQRQVWRQTGMADCDRDHPLTPEGLYRLREGARDSLNRPRTG